MIKKILGLVFVAAVVIAAGYGATRWFGGPGAVAQAPPGGGPRAVQVTVTSSVKKKVPVKVEALGSVTPMASVAVRSRVDSEIMSIHFADGALVKQGDILIKLDSRALEAQIQAAEGLVARDQAQLDGAMRDVRRYTELVEKHATPVTNLDNAKTQQAVWTASKAANEGTLKQLQVQLSYTTLRAPITGRISAATLKVGNFVRTADVNPIATIIQTAPIYVTFSAAQASLPDIRRALAAETATVEAIVPGETRRASGAVTMIENTVDQATGMVAVRATMPNTDELLWPGTLVTAQLTIREEESVVVPTAAVQISQTGTFVFVVADGKAQVRPVKVARTVGKESAIEQGLNAGEVVVTDGHLLLNDGTRVAPRDPRRAGS
jgi:membrane fusion protein, multidrug efflux system